MDAINPITNGRSILRYFTVLARHRELTWEMTKREFTERYAGQVLGYLWAFVHPLMMILVYVFVFSVVFKIRLADSGLNYPGDFTCYLLAGLVPWLATQDALNRGCQTIVSNRSLVKQVMFPLEVLPTNCVIAALLTELILIGGFVTYGLVRLHWVPLTALWIPYLLVVQCLGLFGLTMIVAGIGAYFRDLKDFIQIFCFVNIYIMPVVYLPTWVPAAIRPLLYVNPFSYQTWCFQDALFYGAIEHPLAWVVFTVFNLMCLGVGYRSFRHMKHYFGNVL